MSASAVAAPAAPAAAAAGVSSLRISCECGKDISEQLLAALAEVERFGDDTQAAIKNSRPLRRYLQKAQYKVDKKQQALAGARGFLFQYLHSILHWCDTADCYADDGALLPGGVQVKLEEGQDVDVIRAKKVARKTVLHIEQIQYKHERRPAEISKKSGGYKCIRNAVNTLGDKARGVELTFQYVSTTAKGRKIVDSWIAIHQQLKAHGKLASGQNELITAIKTKLHKTSAKAVAGKAANDLDAQLHKFTGDKGNTKMRQLIASFEWKLNDGGDFAALKKQLWNKLKAVYLAAFPKTKGMHFTLYKEDDIKEEVLQGLIGEVVSRIAESAGDSDSDDADDDDDDDEEEEDAEDVDDGEEQSEGEDEDSGDDSDTDSTSGSSVDRRTLTHSELLAILTKVRDKLHGSPAAWNAFFQQHKEAGYMQVYQVCSNAARYGKVADKAAALGGFETDMLLAQYRHGR